MNRRPGRVALSYLDLTSAKASDRPQIVGGVLLMAVASIIASHTVACSAPARHSSPSSSPATSMTSGQQMPAPQRVEPDSFSGPILAHCPTDSQGHAQDTVTLSKLNIDSGELVDIATYPFSCFLVQGQSDLTHFSPDFHMAAMPSSDVGHVKYYDSRTGVVVDVTNIVSPPPTGDFGDHRNPLDQNPQFDDQGLFVFYDGNTSEYNFFDTDSKKVVRTSPEYMPPLLRKVTNLKSLEYGRLPGGSDYRLCSPWFWLMDDSRYLRSVHDSGGNSYYLVIDSIPGPDSPINCDDSAGQRITPPSTEISGAVADPTGSKIIFMVYSGTNARVKNLYRANVNDPSRPTPIRVPGELLENAGVSGTQIVSLVGWK